MGVLKHSLLIFQVKLTIRNMHWEAKRLCVNQETGRMLVFRLPKVHPWRQNWCQKGLFQCYLKPAIWRQIWINQLAFWRVKWWPQLFTMKLTEGSTSLQQVGFNFVPEYYKSIILCFVPIQGIQTINQYAFWFVAPCIMNL